MNVAVVFESLWGNTRAIADAIGEGLLEAGEDISVQVLPVRDAGHLDLSDVDLLVVGGPTHIRGVSTARTRRMGLTAEEKKPQPAPADPASDGPGVRDWIGELPKREGRFAAAFDTRIEHRFAGGAARGIARRLRRRGYEIRSEPTGFFVQDGPGPLKDGQLERARRWGGELLHQATHTAAR